MSENNDTRFTEQQKEQLNEPLVKELVKQRDGFNDTKLSYLAGHTVIDEGNNIFGFDGISHEILTLKQVDKTIYEKPPYKAGDEPKEMVSIAYLCTLRVTVKCGDSEVVKEDVGYGDGIGANTAYGIGGSIELACKESVTDAYKRCMRFFGKRFGNTLYDKDLISLPDMGEVEAAKTVTEDQLKELRALYEDREINDDWVMAALKGENYDGESFEDMRQDWFQLALRITTKYKLTEINAKYYEDDIVKVIALMKKSVNMNMLKKLFAEAWRKSTEQEDKERQSEIQKLYESMKEGFEK